MIKDKLMLNDDKTEFVLIGTKQQLAKVCIYTLSVGISEVSNSSLVRNLGSWFDCNFTMVTHVNKICKAAFYHLYNIARIRKYLNRQSTEALVHALVTSLVDYSNGLLCAKPYLCKLQRVQNAAARLVFRACHTSPFLFELHWLPIKSRIDFKVILITFKAIHGFAPKYISDLISIKSEIEL